MKGAYGQSQLGKMKTMMKKQSQQQIRSKILTRDQTNLNTRDGLKEE